jgi:hypothetical protein
LDKKFDQTYENLFEIYVEHDCGDSYDFSPSKTHPGKINKIVDTKYQIFSCEEYHNLKIQNTYEIPAAHNSEKIQQTVEFNIHITNNDVISINIHLNNKIKDARWLIKAHANFLTSNIYCNHAYCASSHPVYDKLDKSI